MRRTAPDDQAIAEMKQLMDKISRERAKGDDIDADHLNWLLKDFYTKMLSSRLFVLLHEKIPDDCYDNEGLIKKGTGVPLYTLHFPDGTPCIPCFTSKLDLQKFMLREDQSLEYIQIHGCTLLELCGGTSLMLNNESDNRLFISAEEGKYILSYFGDLKKDEEDNIFTIMDFPVNPVGLKAEVANVLERFPTVTAAYIGFSIYKKSQDHVYIIIIDHDGENYPVEANSVAGLAAKPWLPKGYFIEFHMPDSSAAQDIREIGHLFYLRKGLFSAKGSTSIQSALKH